MREILFRGFHPCEDGDKTVYVEGKAVKGRWVYGAYCYMGDKQQPIPHVISCSKDDEFGDWLQVLPTTVGQYTGLTDKNGVKIFKDDIVVEKHTGYKAVVKWQHDSCRFLAMIINRNSENSPNFFYVDKGNDRGCQMSSNKIIGNTHEEETPCHANHS